MVPDQTTNIKVVVRVRPYNKRELEQNQRCIIKLIDKSTLLFDPDQEDDEFFFQGVKQSYRDITKRVSKKMPMDFDRVFDTENTNTNIFEECTGPLVDAVLNGYNCSVFVYGATGAGKTFTMLGCETSPGLTFLTMKDLFDKMQSQDAERKFDVGVSYLEVYNEQVMNLLTKTGPLKLREDINGVVVSGLVLTPIYSAAELLRLLALGNANRTQHPTDANAESSRSHAVFQVHIRITDRKSSTKRTVKLSMIDLAGSERAASTKGIGVRFKEGASINKSLLALGNCINKLADGLKHIPYRDSNLTRLLKDSLGGNCRTLMVANVSMSSLTYEDTYNTLKYASRAKKIRTTLRQNVVKSNMPKEFYVKRVNELMLQNENLVNRNKVLEEKITAMEKSTQRAGVDEDELLSWYTRIDGVYTAVLKTQEFVYGIRSKIKNLMYRQSLKDNFQNIRKILSIEEERSFQEDFEFTAYITNLNNQREQQKEELQRWRKKLKDAHINVEKLKRQMKESKHSQILLIYQKSKDAEVKMCKQSLINQYLCGINMELVDNSDMMGRAFTNACEVLMQTYGNLESSRKLTPDMVLEIKRHMRLRSTDEVYCKDQGNNLFMPVRRLVSSDEEDVAMSLAPSKKRTRTRRPSAHELDLDLDLNSMDDNSDSDDDRGKENFKIPYSSNQTHILSSCADDEYSSGFETCSDAFKHKYKKGAVLATSETKSRTGNRRLVTEILSDQNARSSADREKIKNALLKSNKFSHQGLQRTMSAASVRKDALQYSANGVRKSPRALIAKALSGASTFTRKPMTTSKLAGGLTGSRDAPIVRINRAASFRVKK